MGKILFISTSTQDKKTWALTVILGILPLTFFGWKMLDVSGVIFWAMMFLLFFSISIIGFVATPYKYILTDTDLIIKRYWRDIKIPLSEIRHVQQIPQNEKKTIRRTFGFAGPFGSFGGYSSARYAKLSVFARRSDNWTFVITDRDKYVIAPDDLQLIDTTMQYAGIAETSLQSIDIQTKNWRFLLYVALFAPAGLLIYFGYKEPAVQIDSNALKLKGLYGVNLPFTEIAKADTILWREMPAISIRTNGISLHKVSRGKFKTADGDKIHLSVNRGVNPVIRIVKQDGFKYYINRKNEIETRLIFNKLKSYTINL
jgi:hypothetical protein